MKNIKMFVVTFFFWVTLSFWNILTLLAILLVLINSLYTLNCSNIITFVGFLIFNLKAFNFIYNFMFHLLLAIFTFYKLHNKKIKKLSVFCIYCSNNLCMINNILLLLTTITLNKVLSFTSSIDLREFLKKIILCKNNYEICLNKTFFCKRSCIVLIFQIVFFSY